MPIVITIRGRSQVRWPDLTERHWLTRNNCSAHKSDVQLHAQRPPPHTSVDAVFARFCGPEGTLAQWPSNEIKVRLGQLHASGFTQRRLGASSNLGRSRLQMRCVYHLARHAASQGLAYHSRKAKAQTRLLACEAGFGAGHAAIVLLSAFEAEQRSSQGNRCFAVHTILICSFPGSDFPSKLVLADCPIQAVLARIVGTQEEVRRTRESTRVYHTSASTAAPGIGHCTPRSCSTLRYSPEGSKLRLNLAS